MQPSNELSTTQQRPRYMIDEYYTIGRPISPVVRIIAESRLWSKNSIYCRSNQPR